MTAMRNKKPALLKQFLWFRIIFIIGDFLSSAFFTILLYRSSESFVVLGMHHAVYFIAIWIGFLLGSYLIHKVGYVSSFKIAFALISLSTSITVIVIPDIGTLYPIVAITKGIARGIAWSIIHLYSLKEFKSAHRGNIFSSIVSVELIAGIIMPSIIGSIITLSNGYEVVYIIGAAVFLVATVLPFKYNKIPRSKIRLSELLFITKQKYFGAYAWLLIISAGLSALYGLFFSILPFLFIRTEFGVGIFSSIIGIAAALLALFQTRIKFKGKLSWGYIGTYISTAGTLLFSIIWTFPMLVFERLLDKIGVSLYGPIGSDVDMRTKEKILKKYVNESAIEMNLVSETLLLTGRVIGILVFVLIVQLTGNHILSIIKISMGIIAVWKLASYVWMVVVYEKMGK